MSLPIELVAQFLDATELDQPLATRLLQQHPQLHSATYLGESLLRFLAIENFAGGVRFLATHGWAIDERDEWNSTPLVEAVRAEATRAVATLIELGADVNAESEIYFNALHSAIEAGQIELVKLLLEAGANPSYLTALGDTALDALPNDPHARNTIRALLSEYGVTEDR